MSDSVQPHRWQPTRLPRPWDSPGKNTAVGCHFLLQCMKVKSESEGAQSCPTLNDPMDGSTPGSSVHGIFQARVLEWGVIAFSDLISRGAKKKKSCIVKTEKQGKDSGLAWLAASTPNSWRWYPRRGPAQVQCFSLNSCAWRGGAESQKSPECVCLKVGKGHFLAKC